MTRHEPFNLQEPLQILIKRTFKEYFGQSQLTWLPRVLPLLMPASDGIAVRFSCKSRWWWFGDEWAKVEKSRALSKGPEPWAWQAAVAHACRHGNKVSAREL